MRDLGKSVNNLGMFREAMKIINVQKGKMPNVNITLAFFNREVGGGG